MSAVRHAVRFARNSNVAGRQTPHSVFQVVVFGRSQPRFPTFKVVVVGRSRTRFPVFKIVVVVQTVGRRRRRIAVASAASTVGRARWV